jgi:hypothetical protein
MPITEMAKPVAHTRRRVIERIIIPPLVIAADCMQYGYRLGKLASRDKLGRRLSRSSRGARHFPPANPEVHIKSAA